EDHVTGGPAAGVATFPYTTLFRSPHLTRGAGPPQERPGRAGSAVSHDRACPAAYVAASRTVSRSSTGVPSRATYAPRTSSSAAPDRKSTRLNSSHVKISYAVFCLK